MNEVTKIHLGRQAFTISIDAHHELRKYLDAINRQLKDEDVLNEVELRMAELLSEHGISDKKVILMSDVNFLKEQLGNPKDFQQDEDEETTPSDTTSGKKLFRDTQNAMVAGVAAGLAEYFGLDVLLVRIAFIIFFLITIGWGLLLYIILWLLMPEAKTSSERLQMQGKPVTVDNLKDVVNKADIKGVASRTGSTVASGLNSIFKVFTNLCGIGFVVAGLGMLFGLISSGIYYFLHINNWSQYNIFPIGTKEHLLLYIVAGITGVVALFTIITGLALFRRKWPLPIWISGALIGLVLIGVACSSALGADVYPNVRDRYNSHVHTTVRTLAPFTSIDINERQVNTDYQTSDRYYVELIYFDNPDISSVKTSVKNNVLLVDASNFKSDRNCPVLCIPNSYRLRVIVHSPNAIDLQNKERQFPEQVVPMTPLKY